MNLSEQVRNIFLHSLYRPEEIQEGKPPADAVLVEGLVQNFGFHPGRLMSQKDAVRIILDQMPDTFKKSGGGGMSFLELCMDKDGNHWAEHPTMEMLVVLAIGQGQAQYCMPRDFWRVLPGGVPYIVFDV